MKKKVNTMNEGAKAVITISEDEFGPALEASHDFDVEVFEVQGWRQNGMQVELTGEYGNLLSFMVDHLGYTEDEASGEIGEEEDFESDSDPFTMARRRFGESKEMERVGIYLVNKLPDGNWAAHTDDGETASVGSYEHVMQFAQGASDEFDAYEEDWTRRNDYDAWREAWREDYMEAKTMKLNAKQLRQIVESVVSENVLRLGEPGAKHAEQKIDNLVDELAFTLAEALEVGEDPDMTADAFFPEVRNALIDAVRKVYADFGGMQA